MPYCSDCGKKYGDEKKFCPYCGAKNIVLFEKQREDILTIPIEKEKVDDIAENGKKFKRKNSKRTTAIPLMLIFLSLFFLLLGGIFYYYQTYYNKATLIVIGLESDIFLNQEYMGKDRIEVELTPKVYTVRAAKNGHYDGFERITLQRGETKTITLIPEIIMGKLVVTSPEAQIFVNDEYVGNDIFNKELVPGVYIVSAKRADYYDAEQWIDLKGGAVVDVVLKPEKGLGTIVITSEGAAIFIENEQIGQNRAERNLSPGTYTITAKKADYLDAQRRVTVARGERHNITLSPKPNYATLTINSPGSEIFINDELSGNNKVEKSLMPGVYRLKAVKENHSDATRNITLNPGERLTLDLIPAQGYGQLKVTSSNSTIYINDEAAGFGSLETRLIPGKYIVKAKREGYQDAVEEIILKTGESYHLQPVPKVIIDPEYYFEIAESHFNKDEFTEAIEWYNKSIQHKRDYSIAYNKRGLCYHYLGEYNRAVNDFNKAIEYNSSFVAAHSNRGNAFFNLNQYENSIKDYTEAIRLNPKYAIAYHNRGFVYQTMGNRAQALIDYDNAVATEPLYVEAYYSRGIVYYDREDYDRAISDFNQAIKIDDRFEKAYYNRALAYHKVKRYDEAVTDFSRAIELYPDYTLAYYGRGVVYYDLQKFSEAISDYDMVVKLNPKNETAFYNRGVAYNELKNENQAISDWKNAARLGSNEARVLLSRMNIGW